MFVMTDQSRFAQTSFLSAFGLIPKLFCSLIGSISRLVPRLRDGTPEPEDDKTSLFIRGKTAFSCFTSCPLQVLDPLSSVENSVSGSCQSLDSSSDR